MASVIVDHLLRWLFFYFSHRILFVSCIFSFSFFFSISFVRILCFRSPFSVLSGMYMVTQGTEPNM